MEAEDIEALRASVDLLREGTDLLVEEGSRWSPVAAHAPRPRRGGARHIDELLAEGEVVAGPGFVIDPDV